MVVGGYGAQVQSQLTMALRSLLECNRLVVFAIKPLLFSGGGGSSKLTRMRYAASWIGSKGEREVSVTVNDYMGKTWQHFVTHRVILARAELIDPVTKDPLVVFGARDQGRTSWFQLHDEGLEPIGGTTQPSPKKRRGPNAT